MSYDYLIVIPVDPLFRPDDARSEAAVEALRRLRPQATDWLVDFEEAPKVYVCPDSFERAACPRALTKPSAFVHGDAFSGAACVAAPICVNGGSRKWIGGGREKIAAISRRRRRVAASKRRSKN
jgi:hypothetical protein